MVNDPYDSRLSFPPIDLGTCETRSFYISPSSNDVRQIFWRLHLSQASSTPVQRLLVMVTALLLVNCNTAPPVDNGEEAVESWREQLSERALDLKNADSLAGVKIPVLKSSMFAKWGKPSIEVSSSGGYRLMYGDPTKPFNRLIIYGYVKPPPTINSPPDASGREKINSGLTGMSVPQKWRYATVKGKNVRWFQESLPSIAHGAYFSTEGFTLSGPDRRVGYYRIVTEGAERNFRARLRTLGW